MGFEPTCPQWTKRFRVVLVMTSSILLLIYFNEFPNPCKNEGTFCGNSIKATIFNFKKTLINSGFEVVFSGSNIASFRVISNQLNFSEVSGTCGNLKEVKTLVISRFFSSKKPQTPLYTTIFYIHINYIDFAHFWELIGNSLGKTFITYY